MAEQTEKMEEINLIDFGQKGKVKKPAKKAAPQPAPAAAATTATGAEAQATNAAAKQDAQPEAVREQKNYEEEYQKLLEKIVNMLKSNNPQLATKARIALKPPAVQREGKKSYWTNFSDTCEKMKRDPKHVMNFFISETGSECDSQQDGSLIVKGKYNSKQIEGLIKKYIQEYVTCQLCKSPNTVLNRDTNTRLYMMECGNCKSTRSVTTITKKKH